MQFHPQPMHSAVAAWIAVAVSSSTGSTSNGRLRTVCVGASTLEKKRDNAPYTRKADALPNAAGLTHDDIIAAVSVHGPAPRKAFRGDQIPRVGCGVPPR